MSNSNGSIWKSPDDGGVGAEDFLAVWPNASTEVKERVRIILNVGNYREKREKALEELADKISKTVLRTGKAITLEPMVAYERKIIHSRLQSSNKVKTHSIGEEPYRRVVISKK